MNTVFTGTNIRNYFISLAVFLVIDMVWLIFIARSLYSKHLGYLMAEKVNYPAAFLFYLLFILGLLIFIINPALTAGSWKSALFYGLLFGLVTYATYDLTNLATVKGWPLLITAIDLIWGSFVSGITAFISYQFIRLFH